MRDAEPERRRVSLRQWLRDANLAWHGVALGQPDWSGPSHTLAVSGEIRPEELAFHWILNAYWEPLEFELPPLNSRSQAWHRWIDTVLDSPNDIVEWRTAPGLPGRTYCAGPDR